MTGDGIGIGGGTETGGATVGWTSGGSLSRSRGVNDVLGVGGFVINVGGSTFMILRLPDEGAAAATVGNSDSLSATIFGFAEELSVIFGAGDDMFAGVSLRFADELSFVFGGGCNILANALLCVAGAPAGVAPSDCRTFRWRQRVAD